MHIPATFLGCSPETTRKLNPSDFIYVAFAHIAGQVSLMLFCKLCIPSGTGGRMGLTHVFGNGGTVRGGRDGALGRAVGP